MAEQTSKRCWYFRIPLIWRILAAFIIGIVIGLTVSECGHNGTLSAKAVERIMAVVQPFGTIMIAMLKMVVFPIIFCSLVVGTASLPLKKFGKIGISVMVWYFMTSLCATIYGIAMAYLFNPQMENAARTAAGNLDAVNAMKTAGASSASIGAFFTSMFKNPFEALATGNFLAIIVFAIIFGLAAKLVVDNQPEGSVASRKVLNLLDLMDSVQIVTFKMIDWVLEYFPIGVLALSIFNFTEYGFKLFLPYSRIAICVIIGVCSMILIVYPVLVFLCCHQNPYPFLLKIKEPILTAFLSRSSAATLPVSMRTAQEKLHLSNILTSFSLPLGATVNMDGVCVHLPVFVILAANIFGLHFGFGQLVVLVISVTFASIGVGGIPGGSIFLLFMVLENMGLDANQTAMIVALAIGINPLLDMFETACNVTGDLVCTYIIGKHNDMIVAPGPQKNA